MPPLIVDTTTNARAVYAVDPDTGVPIPASGPTGTSAQQVQGSRAAGGPAGDNPVKMGGRARSGLPSPVSNEQIVDAWFTTSGALVVGGISYTPANGLANTATILGLGNSTAAPLAILPFDFNGATWDPSVKPNATARLLSSAATTNPTSVKASAGNVFKIIGFNTNAAKRYLKIYNKASAPTVGTDVPVQTFVLEASKPFDITFPKGRYFGTGIAYAITGAAADADTTAIGAGDIECLNLEYA